MTNKDIKDYCKNCDVEPPAMRFKCPECEHNPDNENNLAKDINVPSKEQIIIDGEKEDCKILFRCNHIDDLAAYNMIRNGIKITPENAPIGDFELMLIENTNSPFGFSSVCKRNSKEDIWEYNGLGHSGACSIITALLKQLALKTQECEELKNEYWKLEQGNDFLAEKNSRLKGCLAEIKEITEPFCNACQEFEPEKKGSNCMYCNYGIILRKISEVKKMTDKEQIMIDGVNVSWCKYYLRNIHKSCGQGLVDCEGKDCMFKQLARKTQECEELKKEIINKNEKIKELRFSVSDLTNRLCHLNAEKSFRIVDLEQTLDTVSEYIKDNCNSCQGIKYGGCEKCELKRIKDIINKAKGEGNAV